MAALVDGTGLYSAAVADLYKQGRNALLDVINLERNGEHLKEGYLDDLLSLARGVLDRYDNTATPPAVLRMLKDLCGFVEDMSKRVSTKQSRNPSWRAAQKIKDARGKLEQFLHKVNLICLLLNGQDIAVVVERLDGISTQIVTLTSGPSQQLASSSTSMSTEQNGQQVKALRFGTPPASSSRFNILALPPPDVAPVAISREMSELSSWLLDDGWAPSWMSVSGMGGIGKTFLVRTVCLLAEVREHFHDRILWVRLGTRPKVLELHRDLCEAISGREARLLPSPEDGHNVLYGLACTQRYLVVLDDTWMAPDSPTLAHRGLMALNFLNSSNGSRILVTSRDGSILDRLGVRHRHLELHGFGDEDSYTLFCKHAFNTDEAPSDLEEYARHLAGRCGGLPLVLEVVGKAMRWKEEPAQWKYMLHKLSSSSVLDERARILELLRLSYDQLSPLQQRRFLAITLLDSYVQLFDPVARIAWQSMGLLQLDHYKDDQVAECAFNEALEELVSRSLVDRSLVQNEWIVELAWHIIKEEMRSLEQQPEAEEQNQVDGGSSSTCSFRIAVISEQKLIPALTSPTVVPSLRLFMARETKVLRLNMHSMLQLKVLHLDGQYKPEAASIGKLSELIVLSLDLRGYHEIEEALGNLVKMEHLRIQCDPHDLDLRFLKRMPNLRRLRVSARRATSGSNIKHCHNLRKISLHSHLADAHLNDLLHPESSLKLAYVKSMPRESASGYTGCIPATLKWFEVCEWTGGDTTSNLSEPVFSTCQITRLSISLPMESVPESFERLHSLQKLTLDGCGRLVHLTSLDRLRMLQSLTLNNCGMQSLSISSHPALREMNISSCQSLVEIQQIDAPELQDLEISSCKSLVEIREIDAPKLGKLVISSCKSLVEIREIDAPKLDSLEISSCKSLVEIPEILRYGHSDFIASSSSAQLQRLGASPLSNLSVLNIGQAWESLPECLGCPQTLPQLWWLRLDGKGSLLQLPSFARLPRLSWLRLENCAMQCLSLAAGPPGFPVLTHLEITQFEYLVKIQGLYATRLRELYLEGCPSLVEIDGVHCPGLRRIDQSELGGDGYFPDLNSQQRCIRRTKQQPV